MPMNTPDTIQGSTTRPALGLTGKGRAYIVLTKIQDQWDTYSPAQQTEAEELLIRLAATLRTANTASPVPAGGNVRVPLIGRIAV